MDKASPLSAEEDVIRQKVLLEALTESVLDGVLIVSPEGKLLHFNQHFLNIWQFPEDVLASGSDERALDWAASQTTDPASFRARVREVYDDPNAAVREELAMRDGRVYERFGAPILHANVRYGWVWTFRDITERKRAEQELAYSAARAEFRARMLESIRPLTDPADVKATANRLLGEHLGANRVAYFEVRGKEYFVDGDYVDGLSSIAGGYAIDSFGPELFATLRSGRTASSTNVLADSVLTSDERAGYSALGIRSHITVPIVKDGEFVAGLAAHHSQPRVWGSTETTLIQETAERIWAAVERSAAEAALQISEERQAFLLKLSDALRPLSDPSVVQETACRLLAEHVNAGRAFYCEVDDDAYIMAGQFVRGVDPLPPGRYPIASFGELVIGGYLAGRTLVMSDTQTDPRLPADVQAAWAGVQCRGVIGVPLVKGGQLVAVLGIHVAEARAWPAEEVALIEETAERTWAAVTRAQAEERLRQSEDRFRAAVGAVSNIIWTNNREGLMEGEQAGWASFTGQSAEEYQGFGWARAVHPGDAKSTIDAWNEAVAERKTFVFEHRVRRRDGEWRLCSVRAVPVLEAGEIREWVGVHTDVTEQRRAEAELQEAHVELEMRVQQRTHELARANETLSVEIEERKVLERSRVELIRRIVNTQEEERRRISRDLHDQLGQQMTALRLKLSALSGMTGDDGTMSSNVHQLQEIAQALDGEVSFLASQLRPKALDDFGLTKALGAYTADWSRHLGVQLDFHSSLASDGRVSSEVETHLYRIAQECLNNIAKHARATHVAVLLEETADGLVLMIEDNGVGFDPHAPAASEPGHGLGLVGIRERANLVGGNIEVESSHGRGTTILFKMNGRAHITNAEQQVQPGLG